MNSTKNYLLLFVFVFLTSTINFSCSWFSNNNEDASSNDSIAEITSQDINDTNNNEYTATEFQIPKELRYNKQDENFLIDKLYPIGWSKDGKFAYIVEPADEESGFYLFEIVVFDLINNKTIWSWKPEESEEGDLETTWKENYELFKSSLNKYKISQENKFELKKGKTTFKDNEYQIVLDTKTETQPDYGIDIIKDIKISITSTELGSKEIYNQPTDEYSMILGAFVPGYLLSPNDGRIAVIVQLERIGSEGPPNAVYFNIVGSDLERGFHANTGS